MEIIVWFCCGLVGALIHLSIIKCRGDFSGSKQNIVLIVMGSLLAGPISFLTIFGTWLAVKG